MSTDEQAIRSLVATWMQASIEGDLQQVLKLMADDVVFLTPGQPPFGRKEFEAGFKSMQSTQLRMEGKSEIQEIRTSGDLAYCWNKLEVTITPPDGPSKSRRGDTLSVLQRKPEGGWVIIRDANLLGQAE